MCIRDSTHIHTHTHTEVYNGGGARDVRCGLCGGLAGKVTSGGDYRLMRARETPRYEALNKRPFPAGLSALNALVSPGKIKQAQFTNAPAHSPLLTPSA